MIYIFHSGFRPLRLNICFLVKNVRKETNFTDVDFFVKRKAFGVENFVKNVENNEFSTAFFYFANKLFEKCKLFNFPNTLFNILSDNYSLFRLALHIHFCTAFIHFFAAIIEKREKCRIP